MNAIVRGLKATYNFFAGDAILLVAVAIAFLLAFALERADCPIALVAVSSSPASSAASSPPSPASYVAALASGRPNQATTPATRNALATL